jgi:hypothetical protein
MVLKTRIWVMSFINSDLTSYDQMQYKNSRLQRLKLLRRTAALFYLQHLNPKIYELFGNFYRFEKPLQNTLKDFL